MGTVEMDYDKRWELIHALLEESTDVGDLIDSLLNALSPSERWLGASLLVAAASSGDEERTRIARQRIARVLDAAREVPVLDDVLSAVGHLEDESAYPLVLRHVGHPDERVRGSAAFAFAGMSANNPAINDALLTLARDVDPGVRDWAIFALGRGREIGPVDSAEAVAMYRSALEDPDPEVRNEGRHALALLGDVEALRVVLQQGEASTEILDAAARAADGRLVEPLLAVRAMYDNLDEARLAKALQACRETAGRGGAGVD